MIHPIQDLPPRPSTFLPGSNNLFEIEEASKIEDCVLITNVVWGSPSLPSSYIFETIFASLHSGNNSSLSSYLQFFAVFVHFGRKSYNFVMGKKFILIDLRKREELAVLQKLVPARDLSQNGQVVDQ